MIYDYINSVVTCTQYAVCGLCNVVLLKDADMYCIGRCGLVKG